MQAVLWNASRLLYFAVTLLGTNAGNYFNTLATYIVISDIETILYSKASAGNFGHLKTQGTWYVYLSNGYVFWLETFGA